MHPRQALGWSVMGTGTIATEHMVAAIRAAGHQPLWVVSRNKQYAAHFSQDMEIPHITVDAREALQDKRVGFAYVSAAKNRRKHYILAAAAEGKHLLCDGPIATSSRVAAELADACAKGGVILALNQPLRALSLHQTMRRLVQEGEIGTLQSLLIARGAPFQPPPNRHSDEMVEHDEALLDVTLEDIDLARFLTGQEPAVASALPATDQRAYAVEMSGGAILQAYESFTTAEFESVIMLAGDRGTIIAQGTLSGKGPGTLIRRLNGKNELIPVRDRDQHIETVEAFLTLQKKSGTWLSLVEDNVTALRVAEAIRAAQKKTADGRRRLKRIGGAP